MEVLTPPIYVDFDRLRQYRQWPSTIFLAGSIDMGAAENWQQTVIDDLDEYQGPIIFNPRRDDFDATLEQDISNEKFREQVEWELDHIDRADIVVFYFDPNGKAPITLMELGLTIARQKATVLVSCPPGYWRRGNVQIICQRYEIKVYASLPELIKNLKGILHGTLL